MTPRQGVLIIFDGLGDRPVPALDGRTPLEAAATPHLDGLVAAGLGGFVYPLTPWLPVGTQTGTGLLLGLARADVRHLQRGPIEAAGVGLDLAEGDVALRANFATLRPDGDGFALDDRRAGRIAQGTDALAAALDGLDLGAGITARVRAATQHRAVVVLSGDDLSDAVTDTDPGAGRRHLGVLPSRPRTDEAAAARTAEALNRFIRASHDGLREHAVNASRRAAGHPPATGLITRGAGRHVPIHNLVRYLGLRAAVVAGESTLTGLAHLFGFAVLHEPGFTADAQTDLGAKARAVRRALDEGCDLVFLHIKGTDTAAHDRDADAKRAFLERADAALAPILDDPDLAVAVTGDHSTITLLGPHAGDPVPAALRAPGSRRDLVTTFGETACLAGGLGLISATAFLCALLDHMGRLHNFQAHEHGFYL